MPLIANPNVRDPMSAPWSPVQSGPSTPVTGLAYLPAVTKFKRDNQLLGTAHTSSGLFTPLEGSGSSSPSPSDTGTPEDRADAEAETEVPLVEDDEQPGEEQAAWALTSPAPVTGSPEVLEVEGDYVPTGPPEDDDWGEIPRLPTPPAEIVDRVEEALPTGPTTRVFFQPSEEYGGDAEDLHAQDKTDRNDNTKDRDTLPVLEVGGPREENEDAPGLNDALVHTMDPFQLMGNNSIVAPGAVVNDNDESSIASSSPDEGETPR